MTNKDFSNKWAGPGTVQPQYAGGADAKRAKLEDTMETTNAAQQAYGILWRDPSPSLFCRDARRRLFDALVHEERRAGIAWAMEQYGPMTYSEMIAADIRVGVFPAKSTEKASEER